MSGSPRRNRSLIIVLLILVLGLCGCRPGAERQPEGPPLKLSLAVSPVPYSGLIAIAEGKGYFRDAGLDVSLVPSPSGIMSFELMRGGKAQVAAMTCVAFAAKATKYPSSRILASIGITTGSKVVARKDRNIRVPSDLRGKRVGFTSDTISDYFLYAFLLSENIPPEGVKMVNIPADRQADALVSGEVDAVSAFETFAFDAKRRLGDVAVSWDSQNNLANHWLLVADEPTIRSPEPLKRLLKALIRAERFARDNEEEAFGIISRKWDFDPEFLREARSRTRLGVSLNQSVVASLVNYAGWKMHKEGKTGPPPDVLDYLHTAILDELDPGIVKIYR